MADEKKINNRDTFEDDFGDIDFAEFDGGFGSESNIKSPEKGRVASEVATGMWETVKDQIKAPDLKQFGELAKDTLPTDIQYSTSELIDLPSGIKETIEKNIGPLKKEVRDATKLMSTMLPKEGKIAEILNKITNKLSDGQSSGESGPSKEAQQAASIAAAIGEVMGDVSQRQEAANNVRAAVENERFANTNNILIKILSSNEAISHYNHEVTDKYYRKSLELQYQQLYTAKEHLEVTRLGIETTKSQLEYVIKNTALPDLIKLRNSEQLKETLKNRFRESLADSFYGDWNPLTRFTKNIKTKIGDTMQGITEGFSTFNQMGGMVDMMNGMGDMGMSKSQMAGSMLADMLIGGAKKAGARALGKQFGKTKAGQELFYQMRNMGGDVTTFIRDNLEKTNNSKTLGGKALNKLFRGLNMFTSSPTISTVEFQREDLKNPVAFDGITKASIVKVIPALLNKIYGEVAAIRTGESKPEKFDTIYDFKRNQLVQTSTYMRRSHKEYTKKTGQAIGYGLDSVIDVLAEGMMAIDTPHRKKIVKIALTDYAIYEGKISPEILTKTKFLELLAKAARENPDPERRDGLGKRWLAQVKEQASKLPAFFKENPDKHQYFLDGLKTVQRGLILPNNDFESLHAMGRTGILEKEGIAKYNSYYGSFTQDYEGTRKWAAKHSSKGEYNKKEFLRKKEEYEKQRAEMAKPGEAVKDTFHSLTNKVKETGIYKEAEGILSKTTSFGKGIVRAGISQASPYYNKWVKTPLMQNETVAAIVGVASNMLNQDWEITEDRLKEIAKQVSTDVKNSRLGVSVSEGTVLSYLKDIAKEKGIDLKNKTVKTAKNVYNNYKDVKVGDAIGNLTDIVKKFTNKDELLARSKKVLDTIKNSTFAEEVRKLPEYQELVELQGKLSNAVGSNIKKYQEELDKFMTDKAPNLTEKIKKIANSQGGIKGKASEALNIIEEELNKTKLGQNIVNKTTDAYNKAANLGKSAVDAIKENETLNTAYNTVKDKVGETTDKVVNSTKDLTLEQVANKVSDAVKSGIDKVTNTAQEAIEEGKEKLGLTPNTGTNPQDELKKVSEPANKPKTRFTINDVNKLKAGKKGKQSNAKPKTKLGTDPISELTKATKVEPIHYSTKDPAVMDLIASAWVLLSVYAVYGQKLSPEYGKPISNDDKTIIVECASKITTTLLNGGKVDISFIKKYIGIYDNDLSSSGALYKTIYSVLDGREDFTDISKIKILDKLLGIKKPLDPKDMLITNIIIGDSEPEKKPGILGRFANSIRNTFKGMFKRDKEGKKSEPADKVKEAVANSETLNKDKEENPEVVKDKESGKTKKSSWFNKLDPFAAFGRWLDRRIEREDKLWEEREAAEEKARKEKEESTEKGRAKLKKKTGKWTFKIMQDPIGTIKSALGFQGSDEEVLLETGVSEATIEAAKAGDQNAISEINSIVSQGHAEKRKAGKKNTQTAGGFLIPGHGITYSGAVRTLASILKFTHMVDKKIASTIWGSLLPKGAKKTISLPKLAAKGLWKGIKFVFGPVLRFANDVRRAMREADKKAGNIFASAIKGLGKMVWKLGTGSLGILGSIITGGFGIVANAIAYSTGRVGQAVDTVAESTSASAAYASAQMEAQAEENARKEKERKEAEKKAKHDKDGDGSRDGGIRSRLGLFKKIKNQAVTAYKDKRAEGKNPLMSLLGVIPSMFKFFKGMGGGLGLIASLLGTGFSATKFLLWDGPIKLIKGITGSITWLGSTLWKGLTGLGSLITKIPGVGSAVNAVKGAATTVGGWISSGWNKLKGAAKAVGGAVVGAVDKGLSAIGGKYWDKAKVIFKSWGKWVGVLKGALVKKLGKTAAGRIILKLGSKLVPFAGWALLAYDLVKAAKYFFIDKLPLHSALSKAILTFDIFGNDAPRDPETGEIIEAKPEEDMTEEEKKKFLNELDEETKRTGISMKDRMQQLKHDSNTELGIDKDGKLTNDAEKGKAIIELDDGKPVNLRTVDDILSNDDINPLKFRDLNKRIVARNLKNNHTDPKYVTDYLANLVQYFKHNDPKEGTHYTILFFKDAEGYKENKYDLTKLTSKNMSAAAVATLEYSKLLTSEEYKKRITQLYNMILRDKGLTNIKSNAKKEEEKRKKEEEEASKKVKEATGGNNAVTKPEHKAGGLSAISGGAGTGYDPNKKMPKVNLDALKDVNNDIQKATGGKSSGPITAEALTPIIAKAFKAAGLSPAEQRMFLANVEAETGGKNIRLRENTNYSYDRALKMFPRNMKKSGITREQWATLTADQKADIIYADKGGSKYMGRGIIQLTSAVNYKRAQDVLKSWGINVDIVNNPELVASDPTLAVLTSLAWWKDPQRKDRLYQTSEAGDTTGNRKIVNGGTHGLAQMQAAFANYQQGRGVFAKALTDKGDFVVENDMTLDEAKELNSTPEWASGDSKRALTDEEFAKKIKELDSQVKSGDLSQSKRNELVANLVKDRTAKKIESGYQAPETGEWKKNIKPENTKPVLSDEKLDELMAHGATLQKGQSYNSNTDASDFSDGPAPSMGAGSATGGSERASKAADVATAKENTKSKTRRTYNGKKKGMCSSAVKTALKEGGGFPYLRGDAADLHRKGILRKMGLTHIKDGIAGYSPVKGDVSVIEPGNGKAKWSNYGHISIFNGQRWVTDYDYDDGATPNGLKNMIPYGKHLSTIQSDPKLIHIYRDTQGADPKGESVEESPDTNNGKETTSDVKAAAKDIAATTGQAPGAVIASPNDAASAGSSTATATGGASEIPGGPKDSNSKLTDDKLDALMAGGATVQKTASIPKDMTKEEYNKAVINSTKDRMKEERETEEKKKQIAKREADLDKQLREAEERALQRRLEAKNTAKAVTPVDNNATAPAKAETKSEIANAVKNGESASGLIDNMKQFLKEQRTEVENSARAKTIEENRVDTKGMEELLAKALEQQTRTANAMEELLGLAKSGGLLTRSEDLGEAKGGSSNKPSGGANKPIKPGNRTTHTSNLTGYDF